MGTTQTCWVMPMLHLLQMWSKGGGIYFYIVAALHRAGGTSDLQGPQGGWIDCSLGDKCFGLIQKKQSSFWTVLDGLFWIVLDCFFWINPPGLFFLDQSKNPGLFFLDQSKTLIPQRTINPSKMWIVFLGSIHFPWIVFFGSIQNICPPENNQSIQSPGAT